MEYFEDEEGLTIRQVLILCIGTNKKTRIRLGIIAVSVLLLTMLGILFIYNPMKGVYSSEWYYDVYTFSDNDYTYIDGDTFAVNDLYSLETIKDVIASNESLSSINADDLYYSDIFQVTREEDEKTKKTYFKFVANSKFFSSKEQARTFVEAIANTPIEITKNKIDNLDNAAYLRAYKFYATSYDGMVTSLTNQANYILDTYSSLISKYGDRKISDKYLSDFRNDAESVIDSFKLSTLSTEIKANGYVYKYAENLAVLEARKNDLEKKISVVDNKISALEAQTFTTNDILSEYLVLKEDLSEELKDVEKFITDGATADATEFEAKLVRIYDSLQELTDVLTDSEKTLYGQKQTVYYEIKGVVKEEGTMKLILAILISVFAGVVIAAFVNFILDFRKYQKESEAAKETLEE